MTTLLEIKAAIEKLSPRDYAELMAMLDSFEPMFPVVEPRP
jgi:hypothetical protein